MPEPENPMAGGLLMMFEEQSKYTGLGSALVDIQIMVTATEKTALTKFEPQLLEQELPDHLMAAMPSIVDEHDADMMKSERGFTNKLLPKVAKMQQILNCVRLHESGKGFWVLLDALRSEKVKQYILADKLQEYELQERFKLQKVALIGFYKSLNGDDWLRNDNWLSEEDLWKWYGVGVENGNVVSISLENNRLKGTISPAIDGLYTLKELHVGGNDLGVLPDELGNLKNLEVLRCARSMITGQIPAAFGNLSGLRELVLPCNELEGVIPEEIGACQELVLLELWHNRIMGSLPSTIGRLKNLREVRLWDNRMAGAIPVSIGGCTALTELNLRNNDLCGVVPDSIGKCTGLILVYLQANELEGELPLSLGNCKRLYKLSVWGNKFTDTERLRGALIASVGTHLHIDA
jgi:hypothetical protein